LVAAGAPLTADLAQAQASAVPEIRPSILKGCLPSDALPDSLALIPSPAAAGSAALALDEEFSGLSLDLRDTPRWALVVGQFEFPELADSGMAALGDQEVRSGLSPLHRVVAALDPKRPVRTERHPSGVLPAHDRFSGVVEEQRRRISQAVTQSKKLPATVILISKSQIVEF
jgi:hypothetical protein